MSACFDGYDQCHSSCENNAAANNWTAQQKAECKSGCLFPYGQCVMQAEFDKEGQILSGYQEGQPMPLLQDFQLCITNCGTCLIEDPDPETCELNWLACKIACIESF